MNKSFGFRREDGSFQLLATLGDNDEVLDVGVFNELAGLIKDKLTAALGAKIEVLDLQAAPDYMEGDDV